MEGAMSEKLRSDSYGIEIISDSRVEIGRPEPLTAAEIRGRRER